VALRRRLSPGVPLSSQQAYARLRFEGCQWLSGATGLRYVLPRGERLPALDSATEGEVRLDPDTVITIRGRVVRHAGRETAIALDPPGLGPDVLALLRRGSLAPRPNRRPRGLAWGGDCRGHEQQRAAAARAEMTPLPSVRAAAIRLRQAARASQPGPHRTLQPLQRSEERRDELLEQVDQRWGPVRCPLPDAPQRL